MPVRRAYLVLGLVALMIMALGASAFAAGVLPGSEGPYDTKALVHQTGNEGPNESSVAVMWSPTPGNGGTFTPDANGDIVFTVYRHDKTNGRSFVEIGQCTYNVNTKTASGLNCSVDPNYGYVTYLDTPVVNYEEYSYYVSDNDDADPADLLSKVVVRAFPPAQTRHGNYTEYTNACTACHGLHSSKFKKLLKGPTVTDLCGTCHDGTGSKYDEVRGRVRTGPSWASSSFAAAGPFGDRLKANSGVQTTSVHNVVRAADPSQSVDGPNNIEPDSARIWQAPGSTFTTEFNPYTKYDNNGYREYAYISNDWGSFLACSSCHEPHDRGKNYRILRPVINDRTNIALRGVADVNLNVQDGSSDRGNWQQRTMYTRFLAGGNSVMSYYDPKVEDPAWAMNSARTALKADTGDDDRDGNTTEPKAKAWCDMEVGEGTLPNGGSNIDTSDPNNGYPNAPQWRADPNSPTGYRCMLSRELGGVTTFCTACHRTFMWAEARMAKMSYAYTGNPVGPTGTMSGHDQASVSNGNFVPAGGDLNTGSLGQHKHPISLPPIHAWEEGRIVEGALGTNGEVCRGYDWSGPDSKDATCRGAGQGRLIDPIMPLEGMEEGDPLHPNNAADDPATPAINEGKTLYAENILMCLTCHVPHGSGSERVEVAYKNGGLNNTTNAVRDPITGYLWNRAENNSAPSFGTGEVTHQGQTVGPISPRWETRPGYLPNDVAWYTQYGFSSVLARFNPMASVCFRCHSTTPDAWK